MLAKRIIPCLDINEGKVVKGIKFKNLVEIGNPVELAKRYEKEGADEISFLDINASWEKREISLETVKKVAENLSIPFSVGGGIKSIEDIQNILSVGAEKVSIGSTSVKNPKLITKASKIFGSQAIVVSLDVIKNKNMPSGYEIVIKGGREKTEIDAYSFGKKMEKLGAGEILLNSIDNDGTKKGYDLRLNKLFSKNLSIPIIASGGAGNLNDIKEVLTKGKADAALAASIFHNKKYSIKEVKEYLNKNNITVRI